ncbi:MAG: 30S ribosomal protein S12 methylthiotransferase RimO [Endomicrobium sp.]|jgi:ribosomal protein S12 methylthiotransferase|nr:30S ribosomal protein S12 methylthiotransferase RimO [Endomicrobium sp.]
MQKVAVVVLGCSKNTVEAEYLLGVFRNKGFEITNNIEEADISIIHTCSFIKTAREESEKAIRDVLSVKKKNGLKVYVSGCLSQLLQNKMNSIFPEIDGYVGTGTLKELPQLIFDKEFDKSLLPPGGLNESKYRVLSSSLPSTYLKIAEGCWHKCSFCVIPYLRGNYESRSIKSLIDEAKLLVDNGIKELILIAQDTTSYGYDIYGAFVLDKLLSKLAKISELKWIRLLYAYPSSINDRLLAVFKEYKNICNYMDIPIQHISKDILSAMRRPLNTASIIEKIKNKLPDIILRTSIITGFPGENERDISELISFLQQGYFQYVGVFEYSNQKETDSSKLKKQIKNSVAIERKILIENAQYSVFKSQIDNIIGNNIEFIVENCSQRTSDDKYSITGRCYFQAPEIDGNVMLLSDNPLKLGEFYNGKIIDAKGYNIKVTIGEYNEFGK